MRKEDGASHGEVRETHEGDIASDLNSWTSPQQNFNSSLTIPYPAEEGTTAMRDKVRDDFAAAWNVIYALYCY